MSASLESASANPSAPLEVRIAERALDYVVHPPTGDDAVINFDTPDGLLARFADAVGIPLEPGEAAAADDDVLEAVDLVIRHSVHTSHPRFLNQNFAGPDPISVVGDWLGAALNTTGATFEAAPVFTLMEGAVLDRLGRIAGYVTDEPATPNDRVPSLPPGLFCPGGSTATLFALQLARHRRQPDMVRKGAAAERLVLFVSDTGHYAAVKSAALLGLGMDAVIKVATDEGGAIDPAALDEAVGAARTAGDVPFAVIGTAGTTVTSAFDDLHALADICERESMWLHVDGCWGGSALFSDKQAHLLAGIERSDSFVWNLHKMMGMTQQCTALLVKDPHQLAPCFATGANYIFQPDKQHGEFDSGDRTFQCARRIDVLKLWLAWKVRGDAAFASRIDHAKAMADHARARISGSDDFAMVVGGDFTNVVFTWVPPELRPANLSELDDETRDRIHRMAPKIKARMQKEGTAMVGFQPVHGINTFRLLFMNTTVTVADVDAVLDVIADYGADAWAAVNQAEPAG